MKTKIITNNNLDLDSNIKDITIDEIKKLKNDEQLSNTDIIKYILNNGDIKKNSSLTIKEYFKYLFCRPEFRIFNYR